MQVDLFGEVQEVVRDPIGLIVEQYFNDKFAGKIDLGVGAYRTDEGRSLLFDSVIEAERRILVSASGSEAYLPPEGLESLNKLALELLLSPNSVEVSEARVASIQTVAGSGSLRIGAEFCKRLLNATHVYMSDPSWGAHPFLFQAAGLNFKYFRYWDQANVCLNFEAMIQDLNSAEPGSVVLLQPCSHNPTGVDPTDKQWLALADTLQGKNLVVYFDIAYYGFGLPNIDDETFPIRLFISRGFDVVISQTFSKCMGLYAERLGFLHVVCKSKNDAEKVFGQLREIAKVFHGSPNKHAASIALNILSDPELKRNWFDQLKDCGKRLKEAREMLADELARLGIDWGFIKKQRGMFSYTGLNPQQCENLIQKWHIYCLRSGRIAITGINSGNYQHIALAIKDSLENF